MTNKKLPPLFCLMGPTASGKTPLAIELVKRFPFEIISVDSAMVYKGMDIGTAKPDAAILKIAPHRLIDIADPRDAYSAGQFREDALREIEEIFKKGRFPLLVGGTMLYFHVLINGLAPLPKRDGELREIFQKRIQEEGIAKLHEELEKIDPEAARKIHANDSQRIQRALEVYWQTGKPISKWQKEGTEALAQFNVCALALMPTDRQKLHEKIAKRFEIMLEMGFIKEVERLFARGDLSQDLPSIRSVGYKEAWEYLSGEISEVSMQEKAIIATRQLAKRQLTWLRSWPQLQQFDSEASDLLDQVSLLLQKEMRAE